MRIVDEYVALRALVGDWPAEFPADLFGLTYTRHWRLLSAMAAPTGGRISRSLAALGTEDREVIRRPHELRQPTHHIEAVSRDAYLLKRAPGRDQPWLDRVAEVAAPPLPSRDLGAGLDLGL